MASLSDDDPERQVQFTPPGHAHRWTKVLKNLLKRIVNASTGTPSDGLGEPSESTATPPSAAVQRQAAAEKNGADWCIDEVVVAGGDPPHHHPDPDGPMGPRSESGDNSTRHHGGDGIHDLTGLHHYQGGFLEWLKWRLWPMILTFFNPCFEDPAQERDFQKQSWHSTKALSFYASLFLVLNWVLYLIWNHSVTRYEQVAYYGGLSFFTLPIPFMIAMDFPQRHEIFFQIWFVIAVWYCGVTEVIQIKQCGFYTQNHCFGKDFLAMLYYNAAQPAMMMFVVSKRFYNFIAQFAVFVLLLVLVIPNQKIFARNVISFALFSIFIQGLHYSREKTERRMYELNAQLKVSYRAQQQAQIAESKASLAKRRFASYIFHEVRVPLNTAMLAYQNLQSGHAFKDEFLQQHNNDSVELHALEASLFMMQQVLNDALDLQKMDAGRFESCPRPFPLHRAIRSMMGPIAVATSAKSLNLRVELDERIDRVSCHCEAPEGLWVVGDEIRLRQVLTNLASNAVKFTPSGRGAEIRVSSRLLSPVPSDVAEPPRSTAGDPLIEMDQCGESLVFRLEVQDSGPGINPSDLVDNKLFQPFVQTKVGKMNGSGSGLGLAIVKQIVALSGGRLGVHSRKGEGATFWVELTYPIATVAEVQASRDKHMLLPTPPIINVSPQPAHVEPESYLPLDTESSPFPLVLPGSGSRNIPTTFQRPQSDNHASTVVMTGVTHSTSPLPSSSAASTPQSSAPVSPDVPPLRVLVVDDDSLTRILMKRMLTKLGCIVETANDGQECLDILLNPPNGSDTPPSYDFITLDNHMPIVTGEEVVRHMRVLGRIDFVVSCTGNALVEDQTSFLDSGADRVLTKPIMLKDLKVVIEDALGRRSASGQPVHKLQPP
ncbi:hypothetical protein JAAARDRAFT_207498 [Jaapia argillacea MUCL 33604]|uniref:histidine kinase n=1 Tax=Jaapia argillacea MUCL 33604 TaxID=933084 RepID=A0A067PTK6_9AGAM|nr:hypothetical protein JAAARDRAFT_207498 [Jaapia argillacea MUCL 33604]